MCEEMGGGVCGLGRDIGRDEEGDRRRRRRDRLPERVRQNQEPWLRVRRVREPPGGGDGAP